MSTLRIRSPELPSSRAIGIALMGMALASAAGLAAVAHAAPASPALDATTIRTYDVPAGPLGRTLSNFAVSAGLALSFEPALTDGLTSAPLSGTYTVRGAIDSLLVSTGLEIVSRPDGTFTLRRMATKPAVGESALPTVKVFARAEAETATGRVPGYAAKRSATGTKTDSRLIENPQSISVVTADEIGDRHAESVDEVLRYTAGVTPNQRPLGSDDSSLLRGFELETSGIFVDGLRNSGRTFAAAIEPYGIERLEVLRGPASVLYGQMPPGGMVNAVTKRPTAEPVAEIGVDAGTYRRRQVKADFAGAIDAERTWTYRLTMLGREAETRLDHDQDDRLYVAPSLTWQPDANTRLTVLARYQKDNQQYAFPNQWASPGPLGQIDPGLNTGGDDNRFERANSTLAYEFEHRFNETWSVQQKVRYSHLKNDRTDLFPARIRPDGRTLDRYFQPVETRSKDLLVDTSVQARFDTGPVGHTTLVGLDYARTRNEDRNPYEIGFVDPLDLYNPVYAKLPLIPSTDPTVNRMPSRQLGFYTQDQLTWKRWAVTAGLRHDKAAQSSTTTHLDTGASSIAYDQTAEATSGRLGAVYLFESGWAPYVSYATSFAPEIGNAVSGEPLKPSRGKQVEAGLRYQAPDQQSTYTAAVFDLVRRNVTTTEPGGTGRVQTGEVTSRGVELEARTALTPRIAMVAQYTYLDTEITRSGNGDEGLQQKGAPKHSASLWAKYAFRVADAVPAYTALGMRHLGAMRSTSDGNADLRNGSLTLWDAAVGLERGPWRIALNINNVFNTQKLFDCGTLDSLCYRSAERTANLSAIYRF
ncbi:TonB-dependent siderophore receptor [Rhizobacter sp. Root1221]|uniref:TonB-dependent siderophore receptor n=1 Tax=Rhizobacter sp. Root1221 TaxID=1736433 RepID=UPI0006F3AD2F|nr:TonB-dependent siderophore receptor [Rhizobacter sp. Root1221]KQV89796.1 hypothetical protein ASC87_28715 [Rhizobacter sp. Root1221]